MTDEELLSLYLEHNSDATSLQSILGCSESTARRRVSMAKLRLGMNPMILERLVPSTQNVIEHELELGSVPPEGSRISSAWIKGKHVSVHMVPDRADKALIDVPVPTRTIAYKPVGIRDSKTKRVFIVGDQQIGWWAVRDPNDSKQFNFVPFHDEAAQDVTLKAMALYQPDVVVIIGDFLDYPQLSRFQQEPEFAQTMQASIDTAEALIAKIRKTAGDDATIIFIPGNHETRMQRAIVNNVPALYNLTRPGEKHSLYSVPSLLRFEHHRVECMAEYPSGQYVIAPKHGMLPAIIATHGDPNKKDMRSDSVFGHLVLPGIETFAREYEDGWVTYTRMCVSGCANYSDTGDKVRLTRSNTPSARARMASVPSFGTIDIDRETHMRSYGIHLIRSGAVRFLNKIIVSTLDEPEAA